MSKPASISIGQPSRCGDGPRGGTHARCAKVRAGSETSCFRVIENMGGGFLFRQTPDVDGHDHFLLVLDVAEIAPVKRNGLSSVSRHRDPNEISIADNAVGRVEFNPARSWQIDLTPRMRRAAAEMALSRIATGDVEIAGDKAGGEAERPRGLHHQRRKIAAGAAPRRKRLQGSLRSPR